MKSGKQKKVQLKNLLKVCKHSVNLTKIKHILKIEYIQLS